MPSVEPAPQIILRRHEVLAMVGVSASTLSRIIKQGDFPTQIKLSTHRVGWLKSEVDAWFAAKQARETPASGAPGDLDDDDELYF